MEGFNFALHAAAYRRVVEVHLSTLNGLHVIPAEERDFGDVFQSTIPGRWESLKVFYCITGERLIVDTEVGLGEVSTTGSFTALAVAETDRRGRLLVPIQLFSADAVADRFP